MKEQLKDLLTKYRGLAMPLLIGISLIICAALGIVYFQQQREQNSLKAQIAQLNSIISQPFQISEELQANYEEAQQAIPTELKGEVVILRVLDIAEANGFDVSPGSSEVSITSGSTGTERIGQSNYQVLLFYISIKGEYDKVMAFISDLDSAATLPTLVVEELSIATKEGQTTASLDFVVYTIGR